MFVRLGTQTSIKETITGLFNNYHNDIHTFLMWVRLSAPAEFSFAVARQFPSELQVADTKLELASTVELCTFFFALI